MFWYKNVLVFETSYETFILPFYIGINDFHKGNSVSAKSVNKENRIRIKIVYVTNLVIIPGRDIKLGIDIDIEEILKDRLGDC